MLLTTMSRKPSLTRAAMAILRQFGAGAHMYLPGIGFVNGIDAGNWLDTAFAATAVDSPVGLVMDAANTARGPELVTGTWSTPTFFDNTTTGAGSSVTATPGTTGSRSAVGFATTAGKTYVLTWKIVASGATLSVFCRDGATLGSGTVIASDTTGLQGAVRSFVFTAASANSNLLLTTNTAVSFSVSDISVREVTGAIYAFNNTTAQKPILRGTPILGPERIVNGNFADGGAGWTLNSASVSGGVLNVTSGANFASQTGALTNGAKYLVSFDCTLTSGAQLRVNTASVGALTAGVISWTAATGRLTGEFTSTGTLFSLEARTANFTGTIDNISVREVLGYTTPYYHQYTAASSMRLALSAVPFEMADDHCIISGFNVPSVTAAATRSVVVVGNSSLGNPFSKLGINTSGFIEGQWRDDAAVLRSVPATSAVVANTPIVAAMRKSGINKTLWVDGAQQGAANTGSLGTTTFNAATLGARTNATEFFDGVKNGDIIIKGTVSDAQLLTLTKALAAFQGRTL